MIKNILVLVLILCYSATTYSQGNTFNKIRYNGGTLATKVDPDDWDNQLVVTSDEIKLTLEDGQTLTISPQDVTSLSYGQEAHRRVGTMVALGILLAPLALFGLLHKTRKHFVGIEYSTPEGKSAGLLLQADKNNYRGVLMALKGATGAPISVAEEDKKYVPVGLGAVVSKESNDQPETTEQVEKDSDASIKEQPEAASDEMAVKDAPKIESSTTTGDPTKLKIGMEATEVKSIMGEPTKILKTQTAEGTFTTWEYERNGGRVQLMFQQGKVKSITLM